MRKPTREGKCKCPCCGLGVAPQSLHEHTSECLAWREKFGDPWPKFSYGYMKDIYQPELVEGKDFLRCHICFQHGWDLRFRRITDHIIKVHQVTEAEYLSRFSGSSVRLADTLQKRIKTVAAKYGVENVFQAQEIKDKSRETSLEKYGVPLASQAPEVLAKRDATNMVKYGHINPFGNKEIQEQIRKTNLERFGAENPNQNAEIIAKRVATNLEKYGVAHYFETQEFRDKFVAASMAEFGVPHPMMCEEGRRRCELGFLAKYGVTNPLVLPEIQEKCQVTSKARHGGMHHLSHPDIIAKRKEFLLATYGVDNISKVPAIKEKIIRVIKERFRDGAIPKISSLEKQFSGMVPENVVYSGAFPRYVICR